MAEINRNVDKLEQVDWSQKCFMNLNCSNSCVTCIVNQLVNYVASDKLFAIAVTVFHVVLVSSYYYKKPYSWPPGPSSNIFKQISFYFSTLYDTKPLHIFLDDLGKQYGPIVSIPTGFSRAIYLHDFYFLQKAFDTYEYAFDSKPKRDYARIMMKYELDKGFLWNTGENWRHHRAFLSKYFMGTLPYDRRMELKFKEEVGFFRETMKRHIGETFDPSHLVKMSVENLIFLASFGKTFDYDDNNFKDFVNSLDENNALQTETENCIFLAVLRYIPYVLTKKKAVYRKNEKHIINFLKDVLNDHYHKYKDGKTDDFMYASISERRVCYKDNRPWEMFADEDILQLVKDIYASAVHPTASAILWTYVYMMARPDVQIKVQREIDEKIGHKRTPTWDDFHRMPYTVATINEVLRISCVRAFNSPHVTSIDVSLEDYRIPRGTLVYSNIWAIHHDSNLFPNPSSFIPERFIVNGRVKEPKYFIPFSIGARCCYPGITLARIILFLNLTCTLQHLTLRNPPGQVLETRRNDTMIGGVNQFCIQAVSRCC